MAGVQVAGYDIAFARSRSADFGALNTVVNHNAVAGIADGRRAVPAVFS